FQRFLRNSQRNPVGFEQDATRLDNRSPILRVTFTFTHAHFQGLLGNGLVRENADPNISFTLHGAGQSLTGSFQLAVGQPDRLQRFQSIRTKSNSVPPLRNLTDASFLSFPMLGSFRL